MAAGKYNKDDCIALLQTKQTELLRNGETRVPRRSDFSDAEVEAIKAFLGPWPRALEAAGLKEPSGTNRLERNREKRRLAARRKREARKAERMAGRIADNESPIENLAETPAESHAESTADRIKKDGNPR